MFHATPGVIQSLPWIAFAPSREACSHSGKMIDRPPHPMKPLLRCWLFILCTSLFAAQSPDWHLEFPAFKIAGNLYYVGTADLAVYLVPTPQGNILINSDFPQDVPLIRRGIESLGFKYADTKILLISHAHGDHDAAVGQIQKETKARVMVMEPDVAEVQSTAPGRPGAKVDRVLHDGDTVE